MVDSSVASLGPPWPVRWAVGMPVVAAVSVLFFARAWGVPWHGYSVATVAVVGWMMALTAQWPVLRPGRERSAAAVALVLAGAVAGYWVGWRLPRGLVTTAVPVVALAGFTCLMGWGRSPQWLLRASVIGGSVAAMAVIFLVPFDWPPGVRLGLAMGGMVAAVAVWRDVGRVGVGVASQRLARSVIFAAGVWLPLVWWRQGALLLEFLRWENAAFVGLVVLVAWARPDAGGAGSMAVRRHVMGAALLLAGMAAAGGALAAQREMDSPRAVFAGVGVGALVLAAIVAWPRSPAGRLAVHAWWPEIALVAMALTPWVWRA